MLELVGGREDRGGVDGRAGSAGKYDIIVEAVLEEENLLFLELCG